MDHLDHAAIFQRYLPLHPEDAHRRGRDLGPEGKEKEQPCREQKNSGNDDHDQFSSFIFFRADGHENVLYLSSRK